MPDAADHDPDALEALARAALAEVAPAKHVGALRGIQSADDVATVRFSTTQGGYPGWAWTVSIAVNPGMEPSVLETELMPGDGALVAPDWVPWSDRLEDYLAQQAEAGEQAGAEEGDDEGGDEFGDESDDDDDLDDDDLDDDDDVDGVDIDLHADEDDDLNEDDDLDEESGL